MRFHRNPNPIPTLTAVLAAAWLLPGCRIDNTYPLPDDFGECTEEPESAEAPAGQLTYYEHAKPIIDARCGACHEQGGIAPFALEGYMDAFYNKDAIRSSVSIGAMPPWQPDDCCADYRWDRSLDPAEKATLLAWIDQGALMGDPADEGPPLEVDTGGLSRVDLRVAMSEPFTPKPIIGADEVRCFLLDHTFEEEVFVRGYNVIPGNRSMVHHVIVFTVDEDDAPGLEAMSGQDGRPGWDCYGELAGGVLPTGSIGGMTPGSTGIEYPDDLGVKVRAGSRIVLNMHYDTGNGVGSDQTSIEFTLADSVADEITGTAVGNPLWLAGGGMFIPAGDPDVMFDFAYDPTTITTRGRPFLIYSVNLHMHELGSMGRLAVLRGDGTTECLLNITDWDFNWLGEYFFADPIRFEPGDQLYVECHFDNTAANQRFVDGEQIEPRDIDWGTDEEMCGGILGILEL